MNNYCMRLYGHNCIKWYDTMYEIFYQISWYYCYNYIFDISEMILIRRRARRVAAFHIQSTAFDVCPQNYRIYFL